MSLKACLLRGRSRKTSRCRLSIRDDPLLSSVWEKAFFRTNQGELETSQLGVFVGSFFFFFDLLQSILGVSTDLTYCTYIGEEGNSMGSFAYVWHFSGRRYTIPNRFRCCRYYCLIHLIFVSHMSLHSTLSVLSIYLGSSECAD